MPLVSSPFIPKIQRLTAFGKFTEDRKINTIAVKRGAKRAGFSWQYFLLNRSSTFHSLIEPVAINDIILHSKYKSKMCLIQRTYELKISFR
jgi:hypothetical protein